VGSVGYSKLLLVMQPLKCKGKGDAGSRHRFC
jgi:hypothetical protein